jgi:hypothetical protein
VIERLLAPVDQRSAEAYDGVELACAKLEALTAGADRGAIDAELDMTDSLVHEIEIARPRGNGGEDDGSGG